MLDDDARLLLPQQPNYEGSEADWIASPTSSGSSIDMLAADESFSEYSSDSTSPPCDLGTIERLLRSHPVWFLPEIQRAGAVHLLQSKEHGSFVVRGSSQVNTMAVSVRLPPGTGPYIEHYLIQSQQGVLSLETSKFKFDSIPALIAHYSQCCDELPVQLRLPQALREATNRKQLSSLALLGQEFWRYSMGRSTAGGPPILTSIAGATIAVTSPNGSAPTDSAIDVKMVTSPSSDTFNSNKPDASDIQVTQCNNNNTLNNGTVVPRRKPQSFGVATLNNLNNNPGTTANTPDLLSPATLANSFGTFCHIDTPSDTMSSISSFASAAAPHVLSPTGSFPRTDGAAGGRADRSRARISLDMDRVHQMHANAALEAATMATSSSSTTTSTTITRCIEYQRTRPTPPNTLNLICFEDNNNLTQAVQQRPAPAAFPSSLSVFTPNAGAPHPPPTPSDCDTPMTTSSISFGHHHSSHAAAVRGGPIMSPDSAATSACLQTPSSASSVADSFRQAAARQRPAVSRKPKHYQESDLFEYGQSPLADKIGGGGVNNVGGDYDEFPTATGKIYQTTLSHGPLMLSFRGQREASVVSPRPDLLHEVRTVTSLSDNVLLPTGSCASSASSNASTAASDLEVVEPPTMTPPPPPPIVDAQPLLASQMLFVCPANAVAAPAQLSDSKEASPFYAEPANSLNTPTSSQPVPPVPPQRSAMPPQRIQFAPPSITKTLATPLPSPLDAGPPQLPATTMRPLPDVWSLDSSWMFVNTDTERTAATSATASGNRRPNDTDIDEDDIAAHIADIDYDTDEPWTNTAPATLTRPYPNGSTAADTAPSIIQPAGPRSQTVQQLILARMPELSAKLSGNVRIASCVDNSAALVKCFRISSYDNVNDRSLAGFKHSIQQLERSGASSSVHSDDGTLFSEPWDSSQWETMSWNQYDSSSAATPHTRSGRMATAGCLSEGDTITEEETYVNTVIDNLADATSTTTSATTEQPLQPAQAAGRMDTLSAPAPKVATIMRSRNRIDRSVLNHPRNKLTAALCSADTTTGVGACIAEYAYALAGDASTTFARTIQNFITCTKESHELAPQVIMRNMRQFMSGMKNYLVKHGEGEFQNEVLRARSRLRADEFLNLDQILEGVMHRLVVLPLRAHLYALSVEHYVRAGQIQLLVDNVRHAATRPAADFGIPPTVEPPSAVAMQRIALLLQRLQEAALPLDKLSYLLTVVAAIFETANSTDAEQILGADYFLPLLVYVVAKCEFIGAEVEAEFMYGLLQQSLLTGEAGYYLTALCSAVAVLKGMMAASRAEAAAAVGGGGGSGAGTADRRGKLGTNDTSTLTACSSVLRVIIPDELNGSLQTCTLPVRPNTTTKEVCRSIAHKARITNPQDFALFELVNGEETLLTDAECPQESRLAARGQHCLFAYKRIEAKIAWPTLSNMV